MPKEEVAYIQIGKDLFCPRQLADEKLLEIFIIMVSQDPKVLRRTKDARFAAAIWTRVFRECKEAGQAVRGSDVPPDAEVFHLTI